MTRLSLRHAPAPSPRRGHYSDDGRSWIDEVRHRSYPLLDGADSLEVELEEVGGHSLLGSLAATLSAPYGHVYYRFIGLARSSDPRWPEYAVVGGTFASPRALWASMPPEEAWAPEMRLRFSELREELNVEGWLLAGRGDLPWAYRYTRPWIEIER